MGKRCKEYKAQAKMALKGKYWYGFGMCLLYSLIGGIVSGVISLMTGISTIKTLMMMDYSNPEYYAAQPSAASAFAPLLMIVLMLFVLLPLSIGLMRYFILSARGTATVGELAYPFKNGLLNVILMEIKQAVFLYLWSLLFIIPGIIKTFSYFMIDYMIAENPKLNRKRAFQISNQAMKGYKGKAFLLGLSFIGWILLGMITLGIGLLFLYPYIYATMTEFYIDVKENAFERGIIQEGELPRE